MTKIYSKQARFRLFGFSWVSNLNCMKKKSAKRWRELKCSLHTDSQKIEKTRNEWIDWDQSVKIIITSIDQKEKEQLYLLSERCVLNFLWKISWSYRALELHPLYKKEIWSLVSYLALELVFETILFLFYVPLLFYLTRLWPFDYC